VTKPNAYELNGVIHPINDNDLTVKERFEVELRSPALKGHIYPVLPGDVLVRDNDGSYTKVAPGIAIAGLQIPTEFVITWADWPGDR